MRTPQDKMIQAMIDGLSDTRTSYTEVANTVLDEADRNDRIQAPLWGLIVTYLYNRAARWALQITHTPNQEHIAEMSHAMVVNVLDQEYGRLSNNLTVSGRGFIPPDIK